MLSVDGTLITRQ